MRIAMISIALTLAIFPAPSRADAPPPGHAVVARIDGDALLLWDASSEVSAIVSTKLSDDDANSRIKRAAIRVLADSTKIISKTAKSVTVRVLYNKTGAVSPAYGAATFAGVEHYAELTMTGPEFFGDRGRWKELKENAPMPPWLSFRVTGQLPPR